MKGKEEDGVEESKGSLILCAIASYRPLGNFHAVLPITNSIGYLAYTDVTCSNTAVTPMGEKVIVRLRWV